MRGVQVRAADGVNRLGTVGFIRLGPDMVEPLPKTGDSRDSQLAAGHSGCGAQGARAGGTD